MARISTLAFLVGVFFVASQSAPFCGAFQTLHHRIKRISRHAFIRASSNDNEDVPSSEGQDLAGQFYEQLKKREMAANHDNESDDRDVPTVPQPIRRQEISKTEDNFETDTNSPLPPVRKFTGASPSLFYEQTSSSNALEREREREFNLVGNFERTLGIQVAILFASIVFVVSVGLTGGISDGATRDFGGADEVDDSAIEYMRTDDAAEVLLRQSTTKSDSQWL